MSTKDHDRQDDFIDQDSPSDDDIRNMLLIIQKKVLGSPALNGGFDTLIHKMDNLEKRQDKIIESVDEIHEAIYNPDEGLFARIRDAEESKTGEIHVLNTEIIALKLRQEIDNRDHVKEFEHDKDLMKLIESLKSDVVDMKRGYAIFKWLGITFCSGIIVATIKAFYDYIIQHVKFS